MKTNASFLSALPAVSLHVVVKGLALLAVIFAVSFFTADRLDQLRMQQANQITFTSAEQRTRELECLTRNIYFEAGNEPFEGKVAVAQVTLNRVVSERFASSVCGVVYQKNVFYEKVVCQFSWYCEGNKAKFRPTRNEAWLESEVVAKKVLLEGFRLPSLTEALYYHADYVNPGWKLPRIEKIGRHIFYAERIS
jgi:spore germination cell wall hydrolase CwlJ-like protein